MTNTQIFVKGSQIAYKDCADIVRKMARNLPRELEFIASSFEIMADSFEEKSDLVAKNFTDELIQDAINRCKV